MLKLRAFGILAIGAFLTFSSAEAHGKRNFAAKLHGFNEVPSISTGGVGRFSARLSRDGTSIQYKLIYSKLSSSVLQAHIHFGESKTNGGVIVFLCQSGLSTDPTGLAPACVDEGIVTGTITAANVIGPADQGISPEQFRELIRAIRARATYVNVHTERFSGGEIRGQIR